MASGMFGDDGTNTLVPVLLMSPTFLGCSMCILCLLVVTVCLFPVFFCVRLVDGTDARFTWSEVFVPLWIGLAAVVPGTLLVRARWPVRLLMLARMLCIVAFSIVLRVELERALLVRPLADLWPLFASLLIYEALTTLFICVTTKPTRATYAAEREQGEQRSTLGLGYGGWLLRLFNGVALRFAMWCVLAGASVKRYAMLPLVLLLVLKIVEGVADQRLARRYAAPDEPTPSALGLLATACLGAVCASFLLAFVGLVLANWDSVIENMFSLRYAWPDAFAPLFVLLCFIVRKSQ